MSVRGSDDPEAMAQSMDRARAYIERAAVLESETVRLAGSIRTLCREEQQAYQDRLDAVVEADRTRYRDSSWEERASIHRTKVLDEAIALRKVDRYGDLATDWMESIKILCRAVYRARNDLEAQFEAVKAARFA